MTDQDGSKGGLERLSALSNLLDAKHQSRSCARYGSVTECQSAHAVSGDRSRFLTAAEYALLDEVTELIIPTDDHSPGACRRGRRLRRRPAGRVPRAPLAAT